MAFESSSRDLWPSGAWIARPAEIGGFDQATNGIFELWKELEPMSSPTARDDFDASA